MGIATKSDEESKASNEESGGRNTTKKSKPTKQVDTGEDGSEENEEVEQKPRKLKSKMGVEAHSIGKAKDRKSAATTEDSEKSDEEQAEGMKLNN